MAMQPEDNAGGVVGLVMQVAAAVLVLKRRLGDFQDRLKLNLRTHRVYARAIQWSLLMLIFPLKILICSHLVGLGFRMALRQLRMWS